MRLFSKPALPRRFWFALVGLALVSACGADGEPTRPGVAASGEALIGVTSSTSN